MRHLCVQRELDIKSQDAQPDFDVDVLIEFRLQRPARDSIVYCSRGAPHLMAPAHMEPQEAGRGGHRS